jgi:hypothetical protein
MFEIAQTQQLAPCPLELQTVGTDFQQAIAYVTHLQNR